MKINKKLYIKLLLLIGIFVLFLGLFIKGAVGSTLHFMGYVILALVIIERVRARKKH